MLIILLTLHYMQYFVYLMIQYLFKRIEIQYKYFNVMAVIESYLKETSSNLISSQANPSRFVSRGGSLVVPPLFFKAVDMKPICTFLLHIPLIIQNKEFKDGAFDFMSLNFSL